MMTRMPLKGTINVTLKSRYIRNAKPYFRNLNYYEI